MSPKFSAALLTFAGLVLLGLAFGPGSAALFVLAAGLFLWAALKMVPRASSPLAAAALVLAVVGAYGCGAPPVHTSTGADVAAPIVVAQDDVQDVLLKLQAAHNADAAAYKASSAKTKEWAARINRDADAIDAGMKGVRTWKLANGGPPPSGVFCSVVDAAPNLISLAVSYGVIDTRGADLARNVVAAVSGGCTK